MDKPDSGPGRDDGEQAGGGGPSDQEPTETYRPALYVLTNDVRAMRTELLRGFPSRADVLRWSQRLTVRTLGEVPMHFYEELARQFRLSQAPASETREEPTIRFVEDVEQLGEAIDEVAAEAEEKTRETTRDVYGRSSRSGGEGPPTEGHRERRQGVLLAALLQEAARDRALADAGVTELRERLVATYVNPAYHRAFRQLRKSAGEYINATDEGAGHDPSRQRHIAMRPALDELDQYQAKALRDLLDGLADRGAILDWIEDVALATHGELPRGFGERCYKERSAVELLTAGPERQAGRELFAAHHLIPAFNRGVRDLVGRAGELPDVERSRSKPKQV